MFSGNAQLGADGWMDRSSPGFLVDLQAQLVLVFLFDPVHQEAVKPQLQFAHECAGTNVPEKSKSVTCF